jgi:hypothetical protein
VTAAEHVALAKERIADAISDIETARAVAPSGNVVLLNALVWAEWDLWFSMRSVDDAAALLMKAEEGAA